MSKLELAQKRFQVKGCFTLEGITLTEKEFRELSLTFTRYKSRLKPSKRMVSHRFCLKDVKIEVIPGVAANQRPIPEGSVTEDEYPPLLRRDWGRAEALSRSSTAERRPHSGLSIGEQSLLSLLGQISWDVLNLEGVSVVEGGQERPLGREFLEELGEILSSNWLQLKELSWFQLRELSLKGVDLQMPHTWMTNLKQGRQLSILRLEDSNQRGEFLSTLCSKVLWQHPVLEELDLGQSKLEATEYGLLSRLFDGNYCITRLVLAEPESAELKVIHQNLMERVEQPSLKRFQQEQLTAMNKAHLVETLMASPEEPLYLKLAEGSTLSFGQIQGESISGDFSQGLPEVFKKHPGHLSACWPLSLALEEVLPDGKTMGYYLLEKAYALDRSDYMGVLLKAGVNPLEKPKELGEESLVSRLFLGSSMLRWKKVLIDHLREDLEVFVPNLSRVVAPYPEVDQGLRDIKKHLNQLLSSLLDQLDIPFLLKLFRVGFKSKQAIYETDFRLLLEASRKGVEKAPRNWASLDSLSEGLNQLLVRIQETKGIFFKGYRYHKDMERDVQDLLKKIEKKKKTAYEHDEADRIQEKRDLEARLAGKDIEQERKLAAKDEETAAKLAEQGEELMKQKAKLAEQETKLAEQKAEQETKLAEQETKLAEQETKLAEQGAKLERRLMSIEQMLSTIGLTKRQGEGCLREEGAVGGSPAFFRRESPLVMKEGVEAVDSKEELGRCGSSWEKR